MCSVASTESEDVIACHQDQSPVILAVLLDLQRSQSRKNMASPLEWPSHPPWSDIRLEAQPKATRFRTKVHDRAVQSAAKRQFAVQENQVEHVETGSGKHLTVRTFPTSPYAIVG